VVIAITLTPVRHKRHMQFLYSAPNFWGVSADPLTCPVFLQPPKNRIQPLWNTGSISTILKHPINIFDSEYSSAVFGPHPSPGFGGWQLAWRWCGVALLVAAAAAKAGDWLDCTHIMSSSVIRIGLYCQACSGTLLRRCHTLTDVITYSSLLVLITIVGCGPQQK